MVGDHQSDLVALVRDAGFALDARVVVGLVPELGRFVGRAVWPQADALPELIARLAPQGWSFDPTLWPIYSPLLGGGRVHAAPLREGFPLTGFAPEAVSALLAEQPDASLLLVTVGRTAAPLLCVLIDRPADERDRRFLAALASQAARAREHRRSLELEQAAALRYRLIVENCPEGIALTDLDGHFKAVNPALARLFGTDGPEQLLGRRAGEFYRNPMQRQSFAAQVIAQGVLRDSLQHGRRMDGLPIEMLLSGVLVRDAQGAPAGFVTFVRDVTEERRNAAQRQLLAQVVESSPEPIIIVDDHSLDVTYINRASCRVLGLDSPDQVVGLPALELSRRYAPKVDAEAAIAATRAGGWHSTIDLVDSRGETKPIELATIRVEVEADRYALVAFLHDLSFQRQLQERLVVSEKLTAVGLLVAGVAHELNNPLTTILGCSQLLLERGQGSPTLLRSVERNALRCRAIVDGLLKFARDYRPERIQLNLHALIDEALELRQNDLERGQVIVERRFDPALPDVSADRHQMRQVFVNVVANAIQAMTERPSPRLRVRTERVPARPGVAGGVASPPMVRVTFEDNGHGVPQGQLAKVFDPFFTTKEVGSGTGLGLSLALGVVQQHGGQIRFESSEGLGTVVSIELPLDTPADVDNPLAPGLPVTSQLRIRDSTTGPALDAIRPPARITPAPDPDRTAEPLVACQGGADE